MNFSANSISFKFFISVDYSPWSEYCYTKLVLNLKPFLRRQTAMTLKGIHCKDKYKNIFAANFKHFGLRQRESRVNPSESDK